ncbi:MAG TPA: phosphoserine phosphatase SerB [Acetobacteraceae bacterium]|nr:phosphoserine phosphatase SerB [Acetobacteraceae bacterium]
MAYVLTLVAARDAVSLSTPIIDQVRDAVRGATPRTLSPGEAAEFDVFEPPDLATARAALQGKPIDVLLTRSRGRRRGLLVADMDSTIVTSETLDELADIAGIGEQIAAITRRSMNGELDFREALRTRVALLKGLDVSALETAWARTELTPGAKTLVATMRRHGALTALVSGGFTWFTDRVATLCGFDHHRANTLLDDGKALTGEVTEPILGSDTKLETLREMAALRGLRMTATLAVGDGANDLPMLQEAGLGIGYRPKMLVAETIQNRVEFADLRALLFAQGYSSTVFVDD